MNLFEYQDWFKKLLSWVLPSFFGIAAKLAYESRMKKLSFWGYIVPSLVIACFVGWVCDILCSHWGITDLRGVVVGLSALGADSMLKMFFKNDENIIKSLFAKIFGFKIEKPENGDKNSSNTQSDS